jgi:membrane-associated phospholipid phosphatase
VLLVAGWWLALRAMGGLNSDHLTLGAAILALAYLGRATESLLKLFLPAILTVIIYDSMRWYSDLIRASYIRVQEPYHFDQFFFGITTPEGILTPNEWFQKNTHWFLDLITGFFYIAFVGIFMLIGVYFRFLLPRLAAKARDGLSPDWIRSRAQSMFWAFFWLNMLGYSTYYWYPAAPPWYVSLYGLGPANLSALPNPAGCLRFDQLLGTHLFTDMYGKSADVFGAVPSLHVAYPLLTVLFAFELRSLRAFAMFFYLMMCFSAVYLNHHYILDLIWGSAYTVLVYVVMKRLAKPGELPALTRSMA